VIPDEWCRNVRSQETNLQRSLLGACDRERGGAVTIQVRLSAVGVASGAVGGMDVDIRNYKRISIK
jgi:hypothetical protein